MERPLFLLLICLFVGCSARETVKVENCDQFDGKVYVKSFSDSVQKSRLKVRKHVFNPSSDYDTTCWASELNWEKELQLISNISLCTPSNIDAFTHDTTFLNNSGYIVRFTPVSDKNILKYLQLTFSDQNNRLYDIEAVTGVNNVLYSSVDSLFFNPFHSFRVVSQQKINFINKSSIITIEICFF
jgi:hypothetical protein